METIFKHARGAGKVLTAMMTMFDLFDTYKLEKLDGCWRIEGWISGKYIACASGTLMELFDMCGHRLNELPKSVWANKK